MRLLQEKFSSRRMNWWGGGVWYDARFHVGSFLAKRMGWTDASWFGDVGYRWPFRFLLKKALKKDKVYSYLQILNPKEKFYDFGPWLDS